MIRNAPQGVFKHGSRRHEEADLGREKHCRLVNF